MTDLVGTNSADNIMGTSSGDTILAGNGSDVVDGGAGNDLIDGGNGDDTLDGGLGNDTIYGGNGDDILDGNAGADTVYGGRGDDLIIHVAEENANVTNTYDGGQGTDTLRLIVTSAIYGSQAFRDDLAHFQAMIRQQGTASGTFASLGIQITSFEHIDVQVNDSNHAPTGIDLSNSPVAENSANGTVIGALSATDPDAGDTFTYTLVNDAGGRFAIDGANLVVAGPLDFESSTSHQVTVRVTDAAGASYDATFTIGVTDVAGLHLIDTAGINVLNGGPENDWLEGLAGNDRLGGGGGNDLLDGGPGNDTAAYQLSATGPLTINLAAGTVSGAGVGTDTLRSVEGISGGNFADSFNAVGFTGTSTNAGSSGTFNQFQGNGGDDVITGNGNTRLVFTNATGGVIVDIAAGTADGNVSVGHDVFSGVNGVTGSAFNDVLLGADGPEIFDGRAGDDWIDGRGNRLDQARYGDDPNITGGIVVHLAAGIVNGDASIGNDTLRSIETISGTRFNDVYDATGFDGFSTNAGDLGPWNQYLSGQGGNDTIIGNHNTQINYSQTVIGAVTADIAAGTATYGTNVDHFSNVHWLVGSNSNDFLYGSDNGLFEPEDLFQPVAGNDFIDGRGGHDEVMYGTGASSAVTGGITVHLAAGTLDGDLSIGHDTLRSIEAISATNFDDFFDATGFGAGSTNAGSQGDNNYFTPNGGNDTIIGNGSTTLLYGDAITVNWGAGTVTGNPFTVGTDHFSGVSAIVSGGFNDSFIGDDGANQMMAGAGQDILIGNGGDDFLSGDIGNDELNGGAGTDDLLGGPGDDTFVFAVGNEIDRINDFTAGAGTEDRIDLTLMPGVHTFGEVMDLATDDGVDTTIDFGNGDMIVLNGVLTTQLHQDDFLLA